MLEIWSMIISSVKHLQMQKILVTWAIHLHESLILDHGDVFPTIEHHKWVWDAPPQIAYEKE